MARNPKNSSATSANHIAGAFLSPPRIKEGLAGQLLLRRIFVFRFCFLQTIGFFLLVAFGC